MAPHAVARPELALEVDTPHGVGAIALSERQLGDDRHLAPLAPLLQKPVAIQDRRDAARFRPLRARMRRHECVQKLASSPGRSLLACRDHHRLDFVADLRRRGVRSRRAIDESIKAARLAIALEPIVTGLPAYAKHPTELGHVYATALRELETLLPFQHELCSLLHRVRHFPGH